MELNEKWGKLQQGLCRFASLIAILFLAVVAVRLYEYSYLTRVTTFSQNYFILIYKSLGYDILLTLNISAFLILPFTLLYILNDKAAVIFFKISAVCILLSLLAMVNYFAVTLIPLDDVVFSYSWREMYSAFKASGNFNFMIFIPFLVIVFAYLYLNRFSSKIKIAFPFVLFLIVGSIATASSDSAVAPQKEYLREMDYYLVNNKLSYFCSRCYRNLNNTETEAENFVADNATDPEYPLLRKPDNKDVLGAYFNLGDKKPNIVFVIVESLSRAFSGLDTYKGSFTPFLDSLSDNSLYFPNFLSNTGRTFGVLPSLFGSLPYGDNGFAAIENMPAHTSLIRILKDNGYLANFYYGGDPRFDNMEAFLQKQNIDGIHYSFGSNYKKMPGNADGFSWGYSDKDVYKRSFEILRGYSDTIPRLDIYMTLTTHSPFITPDKELYSAKFEERLNELKFNAEKKAEYRKSENIYSTILYADEALNYFFSEYKKRPDYNNTIFIITGDHNMPEISQETRLDRYHVPFIVYSPMLKKAEKIASVSSHQDVAPSLLSLLGAKYKIASPEKVHWLGDGIDTAKTFRNIHTIVMMRNKGDLSDYFDKDYFLSNGVLYKVYENLYIEPLEDKQALKQLQGKLNGFKKTNDYVCSQNKLFRPF